jgi:hypothetical protein
MSCHTPKEAKQNEGKKKIENENSEMITARLVGDSLRDFRTLLIIST